MCLILFAFRMVPESDLLILANRDEFHARPTQQAGFWADIPDILAGKDLQEGGTWLGVNRGGRFAAVTNFRDLSVQESGARSRGHLVRNFLAGCASASTFMEKVLQEGDQYRGFNLICCDGTDLVWGSNRSDESARVLKPGIHGVSNHLLDTPWPKVVDGKRELAALLEAGDWTQEELMGVLADGTLATDDRLPDTGVGPELEKMLSARCITGSNYGTRCSTLVSIKPDGSVVFVERTRVPVNLEKDTVRFEFRTTADGCE